MSSAVVGSWSSVETSMANTTPGSIATAGVSSIEESTCSDKPNKGVARIKAVRVPIAGGVSIKSASGARHLQSPSLDFRETAPAFSQTPRRCR